MLRKNLKRHLKPITFYQIQRGNKITITLDMLHLKMVVEVAEEALETLTFQDHFQIFLKIFLVKVLVVVEEDQEDLTTVALI